MNLAHLLQRQAVERSNAIHRETGDAFEPFGFLAGQPDRIAQPQHLRPLANQPPCLAREVPPSRLSRRHIPKDCP